MNVYSRGGLLKLQQDLVRDYFGSYVYIHVFCNSNRDFRHLEDSYHQTHINSGHHNGVRDSYNEAVNHLDGYDYIISSHADCIMTDYSIVDDILIKMRNGGKKFACLAKSSGINPHRKNLGFIPRAHADFFICDVSVFKQIFPTNHDLEEWEGIESFLGRMVHELIPKDEIMVIPAKEHFDNQEERPGAFVSRPYRFEDVMYPGVVALRDNEFDPENFEAFKNNLKTSLK